MNTVTAQKLISLLARFAALSLAAFVLAVAVASDTGALALFALAASTLVLLVAVCDYTPQPSYWQPRASNVLEFAPAVAPLGQQEKLAA